MISCDWIAWLLLFSVIFLLWIFIFKRKKTINLLFVLFLTSFFIFNVNFHSLTSFDFFKNLNKQLNNIFYNIFNMVSCEKLIFYFSYIIHIAFIFLFILIIFKKIKEKKNKIIFLLFLFFMYILIYASKDTTFSKNFFSCIHTIFCVGFKNFFYSRFYCFLIAFFIFITFYVVYFNINLVSFFKTKKKLFNFYNIHSYIHFSKSNFCANYNNLLITIKYYYTFFKTFFLKNKTNWRPTFKKFSFFDVFLKNKNKWSKK